MANSILKQIDPKVTQDVVDKIIAAQNILLQSSDDATESLSKYGDRLGKVFQNIVTNSSDINHSIKKSMELMDAGNAQWKNRERLLKIESEAQKKLSVILSQREKIVTELRAYQQKDIKAYGEINQKIKENAEALKKLHDEAAKLDESDVNYRGKNNSLLIQQNKLLEKGKELEEARGKIISRTSETVKIELLTAQEEQLKVLLDQNKAYLDNYKIAGKLGNAWAALKGPIGDAAKAFLPAMSAGLFLKSAVDYYFLIDTYSTNFAKNSGLSKDFAKSISDHYSSTAISFNRLNSSLDKSLLTTRAQSTAQSELQESSGQLSLYTDKSVQDHIYLTKQLGLQGDEAARINQLGLINSTTTDSVTDSVFQQVAAANSLNGIRLSGRAVLKDVAKIEGVIAANYNNNPIQLAKAIAQARVLGTTIQEAAQASRGLLEFESSIESELEAELLTGKAWNLEKARALALSGDVAGALREELKNVGSLADFQQQNVLAKEAEAKAVGMTVDQLSDALRQQEVLKTSTKETSEAYKKIQSSIKGSSNEAKYMAELNSATNGTELKAREDIVSKQIEMEQSMERVGDAMKSMVSGPLGSLIQGFASILNTTGGVATATALGATYMGFMAARAIATAFASEATAAAIGNVVGLVAGAAALTYALTAVDKAPTPITHVQDALIAPTGQIMVQTGEGKLIKPSPRDSVLVAPNAGDAIGGGGSNVSNSRIENLLSAILGSVSKPGSVMLDSYRVGTVQGMAYSSYA